MPTLTLTGSTCLSFRRNAQFFYYLLARAPFTSPIQPELVLVVILTAFGSGMCRPTAAANQRGPQEFRAIHSLDTRYHILLAYLEPLLHTKSMPPRLCLAGGSS